MSDALIAELREQVKSARDEAAQRRTASKELKAQIAKLTTDLASATQQVTELTAKAGKTPPESQTTIDSLKGELRDLKHKSAFKEAAIAAGVRLNAVNAAWQVLGLKAETDEVDAEAFAAALDGAKESHDFLFGAGEKTTANPPSGPPPEPPPRALGGDRGGRAGGGKWRVKESQQADPVWCHANDKALREASKNGTLEIIAG